MEITIILGLLLLLFLFFGFIIAMIWIVIYNKFIKYRNKVEESLSLIDVQLKMRFDLVPNLVECVKGYVKHEEETLSKLVELRNLAANQTQEKDKIATANKMVKEFKNFFVTVENYPELKASALFKNLMEELAEIEDRIAASRRFYNSNVNYFNTMVDSFPSSIIAKMNGFKKQELFKIEANEKVLEAIKF